MPVSAGTGKFLDNDSYEEVEVGPEVPETADFEVRISGDSKMPRYLDKQIVWIQNTDLATAVGMCERSISDIEFEKNPASLETAFAIIA